MDNCVPVSAAAPHIGASIKRNLYLNFREDGFKVPNKGQDEKIAF
jgi:hypothetical protein